MASWAHRDRVEAAVMICSVIKHLGRLAAGDDASRSAIARTGRRDGVFAIVATRLLGEPLFSIEKSRAVLAVREGSVPQNQLKRFQRLGRQSNIRLDDGCIF